MKIVTKEMADFTRGRILETSKELFYQHGYSKVTMDEVAQKLGMSKKTLYRYFESKYDIISHIVQIFKDDLSNGVDDIINDESLEYPVKLKKMLNFVALKLSGISVLLMEDLQKILPDLWDELNKLKREGAFNRFNKLIEEGRRKSMINERINLQVIVALYASAIQNLLDPDFMNQLPAGIVEKMPTSPSEIFDNMINIIYEGILTEETKKDYQQLHSVNKAT
jgi:AcrR family transcriptional regulator